MIIDGKAISQAVKDEVKAEVAGIVSRGERVPCLCVIIVGDNSASQVYVRNKIKAAAYTGMESKLVELPAAVSEDELLSQIVHTLLNLLRLRNPVLRRPAFDHIADIHTGAVQTDGGQHFIKQLPRRTHKRTPGEIFLLTRSLTDQHQRAVRIPFPDHRVFPTGRKRTAGAALYCAAKFFP